MTASKPISIRLSEDLLARIDAVAAASGGPMGITVDRSAVIRALVMTALPMAEEAAKVPKAKPGVRRAGR